jgi:hypothetical protein
MFITAFKTASTYPINTLSILLPPSLGPYLASLPIRNNNNNTLNYRMNSDDSSFLKTHVPATVY